jgi:hypothetical protein
VNHFLFSSVTKRCIETPLFPAVKLATAKLADANGARRWQPLRRERRIRDLPVAVCVVGD